MNFVQLLHDANAIVCTLQSVMGIPAFINEQVEHWRREWKEKASASRPLTAPSQYAKSNLDVSERLQNELTAVSSLSEAFSKNN